MELYDAQEYVYEKLRDAKASHVLVTAQDAQDTQLKFVNNNIIVNKTWISEDISLFVAFGQKTLTTSIQNKEKKSIDAKIKKLLALSKQAPRDTDFRGLAQGPFRYKKVPGLYDKKISALGYKAVDLTNAAINEALNFGATRSSGVLEFGDMKQRIISSGKVKAKTKGTTISFSMRSFADHDASGHQVGAATLLKNIDIPKIASLAASKARAAKNPIHGKPGTYNILFEPLPFANLLTEVGSAASIFSKEAGFSFLQDRLNKKVASKSVTIYDWGNMPEGYGSDAFDEEGYPTQKTPIIKNGVFKNFLHNYSTAQRYNTKSTGNAGIGAPSVNNIIFEPGDYGLPELLKATKNGLFVTNTWYTRFTDYIEGEFSTIPRDAIHLIKDGEITKPIKGIRISDNMLNILKNVVAIGKESQSIIGWDVEEPVVTPAVLVKNVRITRSKLPIGGKEL